MVPLIHNSPAGFLVRSIRDDFSGRVPPMALVQWEAIIQQIVDDLTHEPKRAEKQRLLVGWRDKLEKEPPHLRLHLIDEIMREVWQRLESAGEPSGNK